MLHAIFLAGGVGARLWPESSEHRPKQFLKFLGDQTLLETTVQRVESFIPRERQLIVTGQSMVPLVYESFPGLAPNRILAEPVGRNTAPSVGLAAIRVLRDDPDATMLVLPADQIVKQEPLFRETVRFAAELVEEEPARLILLGVKPTFPSSAYGYIEQNERLTGPIAEKWGERIEAFSVKRFHEKPDRAKAEEFLASGRFRWNAGIFVWKARTILEQLRRFEPEIADRLDTIASSVIQDDFPGILEREFTAMKRISIDYAVLERAENIFVLDATFDWDDVGTWTALDRIHAGKHDAAGNLALGANLLATKADRNIVKSHDPNHVFALVGVDDLVIIQTAEATLIAKKEAVERERE
ncbi:MAG: mannose-1-phosphate guanylyltransferase [Planctomycetaceae bacterium]|nr:mannose-1-phosphate guanylyltransferase [Planctomycetaceae bacterium]